MVAIAGEVRNSPLGGVLNPRLSLGLNGFRFDQWPGHEDICHDNPRGTLISQLPVSALGRTVAGRHCTTPVDDWYYRIHFMPRSIDLGNVVSTQVSEVLVWNAWLHTVTLASIDGAGQGIQVTGPNDFPLAMTALRLASWDISVTPNGPTVIEVTLTWDFTSVPDATLRITGVRIVAWTLLPDWKEGVRERLAWDTDVMSSDERDEQRRAVRLSPLRAFDIPRMLLEDRERTLFDLQMHGWGGRVWAIPVWPDIQRLTAPLASGSISIPCSTTGRDFVAGGLAMLRDASAFSCEVVEIESISGGSLTLKRPTQATWPRGTRLYPARTARLAEQPQERRLTDTAIAVSASFVLVEPADWPEAAMPSYRGLPVFESRPDESEDLTNTFQRAMFELENLSGFPFVLDTGDAAFRVQAHRWVLNGVSERSTFRSLLYALRGRQVSVWLPTHSDDVRLTASVSAVSLSLTIENVAYARFGLGQLGRQDLRIELRNGTVLYRRITNAAAIDDATEQLTIDTALGVLVNPSDVRRVSFMMLARGESDVTEIQHITDVDGVATSRKLFVGVKDE